MYSRLLSFACGPSGDACYRELTAALTTIDRKYSVEATQLAASAAAAAASHGNKAAANTELPLRAAKKPIATKEKGKKTRNTHALRGGRVAAATTLQ